MTINEYPRIQEQTEGCYYWGFCVAVEIQMALFLPLFIVAAERLGRSSKALGDLLLVSLLLFGCYINYQVLEKWNLSYTLGSSYNLHMANHWNYHAYAYIDDAAIGMLLARWYIRLKERKNN